MLTRLAAAIGAGWQQRCSNCCHMPCGRQGVPLPAAGASSLCTHPYNLHAAGEAAIGDKMAALGLTRGRLGRQQKPPALHDEHAAGKHTTTGAGEAGKDWPSSAAAIAAAHRLMTISKCRAGATGQEAAAGAPSTTRASGGTGTYYPTAHIGVSDEQGGSCRCPPGSSAAAPQLSAAAAAAGCPSCPPWCCACCCCCFLIHNPPQSSTSVPLQLLHHCALQGSAATWRTGTPAFRTLK
jgi:hypothetical protein